MNGMQCKHTTLTAPDCLCEQGTQDLSSQNEAGGYSAECFHGWPFVFGGLKSAQIIQYTVKQQWSFLYYT